MVIIHPHVLFFPSFPSPRFLPPHWLEQTKVFVTTGAVPTQMDWQWTVSAAPLPIPPMAPGLTMMKSTQPACWRGSESENNDSEMQRCWEVVGNFIPKLQKCDRRLSWFSSNTFLWIWFLCKNISTKKELKNLNAFLHFHVPWWIYCIWLEMQWECNLVMLKS